MQKQHQKKLRSSGLLIGREVIPRRGLLYDVDGETGGSLEGTVSGTPMTMYRVLEVVGSELPEGTYEIEYIDFDSFMRPKKLPRVEVMRDGERLTVTGDRWKGQETLKLPTY